ncbi:MAG: transaldolase [Myxococcota bacterium]
MNPRIEQLQQRGQSLWYDNVRRSFLAPGGEMHTFITEQTVLGVTSNPTIFEKAIAASSDYDDAFAALVAQGADADTIYTALVVDDIRRTADLLLPTYEQHHKRDGYVSIEVSPLLANNTERTVAEALSLYAQVGRPNVMIKVPGTDAGIPAIRALTAAGISVNVTLLFSLSQYEAIANAYLEGLAERAAAGHRLEDIASVASFFVSRVDTLIDKRLAAQHPAQSEQLRGQAAIANAKLAYARGKQLFSGPAWEKRVAQGAQAQRLLWASTGTKDPRYSDTLYVDELIGAETVNTVPPATLKAFLDHGSVRPSLEQGLESAQHLVERLAERGISLEEVGQVLQQEGVVAFEQSFRTLMQAIESRRQRALQS